MTASAEFGVNLKAGGPPKVVAGCRRAKVFAAPPRRRTTAPQPTDAARGALDRCAPRPEVSSEPRTYAPAVTAPLSICFAVSTAVLLPM
jgi:hypothetical protein